MKSIAFEKLSPSATPQAPQGRRFFCVFPFFFLFWLTEKCQYIWVAVRRGGILRRPHLPLLHIATEKKKSNRALAPIRVTRLSAGRRLNGCRALSFPDCQTWWVKALFCFFLIPFSLLSNNSWTQTWWHYSGADRSKKSNTRTPTCGLSNCSMVSGLGRISALSSIIQHACNKNNTSAGKSVRMHGNHCLWF